MPETRGPAGVKDSALNRPFKFRAIIEGGMEATDTETVRQMCLANISFTAGFGQMVNEIRVQVGEQTTPLVNQHGILTDTPG